MARRAKRRSERAPLRSTRTSSSRSSPRLLYLRFHGTTGKYAGEYGPDGLRPWSLLARSALARGLPVHAYFNNTMGGDAVRDAVRFEEMLGSRLVSAAIRARSASEGASFPVACASGSWRTASLAITGN